MAIISRQVVNEVLEKDVSTCEQIDKAADNKQSGTFSTLAQTTKLYYFV